MLHILHGKLCYTGVPEEEPQVCNLNITAQEGIHRMVWSDNIHTQRYTCDNTITAPRGSRIRIFFSEFLLNCRLSAPLGCSFPNTLSLTLQDGESVGTPVTGNTLPLPFISTTNVVKIRFQAKQTLDWAWQYRGTKYKFHYTGKFNSPMNIHPRWGPRGRKLFIVAKHKRM